MLEICVEDVAGVHAALEGGGRLEVCAALALGRLTPSTALVAYAARQGAQVQAMVRPRAGGVHSSAAEQAVMAEDLAAMLDAGADGVVLGAADAEGELDEDAVQRLIQVARRVGGQGVGSTLHQMIDLVADPTEIMPQCLPWTN